MYLSDEISENKGHIKIVGQNKRNIGNYRAS